MHIVAAAIECFSTKGFHQTSIRDIAERANISLGNLYNHFDSKAALILEIASVEAQELKPYRNIPVDFPDPDKALRTFVTNHLKTLAYREQVVLYIEVARESLWHEDIARCFEDNRLVIVNYLKSILKAGIAKGLYDPKLSCLETAELIVGAVEGLGLRVQFQGKSVSPKARAALVHNLLKMIHK